MEKGMTIEEAPKSRWRRGLPLLLAVVIVLSVAVLTLTVSGTWYIQQLKSSCVAKATVPNGERQEEFNIKKNDGSDMVEHIVVYEDMGVEFITVKHVDTGYITQVVTVQRNINIIAIYSSAVNKCVLAKAELPGIEDDLEYFRAHNGTTFDNPEETRNYVIGARVTTTDDVPIQMMPYCTLRNTYTVREVGNDGRVKRHSCWGISLGRVCIGVSY